MSDIKVSNLLNTKTTDKIKNYDLTINQNLQSKHFSETQNLYFMEVQNIMIGILNASNGKLYSNCL